MESNFILPDLESRSAYNALAPFYERHWGSTFLESAKNLFREFLGGRTSFGSRVLDLCCGTGEFAEWLDARGMVVTGIDNSAQMLASAQTKLVGSDFYKADMRAFRLPNQFDAVTCFYNSINQAMTHTALRGTLTSVRSHLRAGGWFLFDLVEEDGYIDSWEADEVVQRDGNFCELRYRYDRVRGIALCHVTINGAAAGQNCEFTLRQRPYSIQTLQRELKSAGFVVDAIAPVRHALPPIGRLVVLARAREFEATRDLRGMRRIDAGQLKEFACAMQQGDQTRGAQSRELACMLPHTFRQLNLATADWKSK